MCVSAMKKMVILKDNGGRLANQLWNFASIYAFCLEKNYQCRNYAFFRYQHYFNVKCFGVFYRVLAWFYQWRKNYKLCKIFNYAYFRLVKLFVGQRVIDDQDADFNLPPSANENSDQIKIAQEIGNPHHQTYYFNGWLFRNPTGLVKHLGAVREYFKPKEQYCSQITKLKNELKEKYKLIVGVHVRQGDYKTWQGGKFYYTGGEVASILRDYLDQQKQYQPQEVVFVICSDGPINDSDFNGLNIARGPGSEITDLYMLAETDLIIGSTSTYGTWAAYYGQIPFYHFSREPIDWNIKNIPC